jgi:mannose-6-phosphate isomerase-like protein (cupin superfamily)
MSSQPGFVVIEATELETDESSRSFQGHQHGDAGVSLILVDMRPGGRVRLHRHPYEEVFVVQEGRARFTVEAEELEVQAPRIVIVRPGVTHGFMNPGPGPLRQVDIHVSPRMVTEWLED